MSALALPGVDTLPPEHLRQVSLSQWWTPDDVARRLADWTGRPPTSWRILEPSAGGGALVRAKIATSPVGVTFDAIEIDPRHADALRAQGLPGVNVECGDYLARPAPAEKYDLCLMNPPYEGGLDSRFIAKAMAESKRVVALVRLAMLETQRTYERVWEHVQCGDWALVGMAVFVRRPVFVAPGADSTGGMTAFAAVKLSRVYGDRQERGTHVEWW